MALKPVTHVLFDMDGLILDTEPLYFTVHDKLLQTFGLRYSWDVKIKAMGMTGPEVARFFVEHYKLPVSPETYEALTSAHYQSVMSNAPLMPDTEHIYQSIMTKLVGSFGREYTRAVRLAVLGVTEQKTAEIAVRELQLPCTNAEFLTLYQNIYTIDLADAQLMPGAEKLIRHLHKHNIPIAVATSSSLPSVLIKTQNHQDLFALFSHLVSGTSDSEVKEGKPKPDIFLVTASRFKDKPSPDQCLVLEDAPNGVQAAVAAGMQVVMVPDKNISEEYRKNATLVINSLEDFKPELFGLPPY